MSSLVHSRHRAPAPLFLTALLALPLALTAPAQGAPYHEMICNGPLQMVTATPRAMLLRARAGMRAARPAPGECVWRDRGVNRRGERMRNGNILIRIPGNYVPHVRFERGRYSGRVSAPNFGRVVWNRATRGGIFSIEASRIGPGRYIGRPFRGRVVAEPAPPAPGPGSPARVSAVRVTINSIRVIDDGDSVSPGDWIVALAASSAANPRNARGERWPTRGTKNVKSGRSYRPHLSTILTDLRPNEPVRVALTVTDCDGDALVDLFAALNSILRVPGSVNLGRLLQRITKSGGGCGGEEVFEASGAHDIAGTAFNFAPSEWRRGTSFRRRVSANGVSYVVSGRIMPVR